MTTISFFKFPYRWEVYSLRKGKFFESNKSICLSLSKYSTHYVFFLLSIINCINIESIHFELNENNIRNFLLVFNSYSRIRAKRGIKFIPTTTFSVRNSQTECILTEIRKPYSLCDAILKIKGDNYIKGPRTFLCYVIYGQSHTLNIHAHVTYLFTNNTLWGCCWLSIHSLS